MEGDFLTGIPEPTGTVALDLPCSPTVGGLGPGPQSLRSPPPAPMAALPLLWAQPHSHTGWGLGHGGMGISTQHPEWHFQTHSTSIPWEPVQNKSESPIRLRAS